METTKAAPHNRIGEIEEVIRYERMRSKPKKDKIAKNQTENIIIIQWNANGIDKNGPELIKKLETRRIDPQIICIQETFLKPPKTFEIKGFTAIRKDRKDKAKGGLITFIKEGMSYQEITGPEKTECKITA